MHTSRRWGPVRCESRVPSAETRDVAIVMLRLRSPEFEF